MPKKTKRLLTIGSRYARTSDVTLYEGRCEDFLPQIPRGEVQLVVTSPPYNIGKKYERRNKLSIEQYIEQQRHVVAHCVDKLSPTGSICWQVGNHVANNELYPIDIMLYPLFRELGMVLRNRIIWHFEHGLHCTRRLSGRYETILWFTRPGNDYTFNLDAVRVPQKYPGKKYFKGPKAGQYSANPLGKNPSDLWVIPNVKHNHVEKTAHPCQFPVELVERLVLALTRPGDLVFDPYLGAGTAAVAATLHGRRAAGADTVAEYVRIAKHRVEEASRGTLRVRPMNRPVYKPQGSITVAPWDRPQTKAPLLGPGD
ncbi:MAG: site-specific DNA-methyltransferase [Candidatus Eremiobacteraeota bacterium]|nr:site-specific DNA-methyltransferase [Candidatus Eremiobacteraeota bacterium]